MQNTSRLQGQRHVTSMWCAVDVSGCARGVAVPLQVLDKPQYAYRGLLLDVAHVFMSTAQMLKLVVGLSMAKFNVLHLHLTDEQAFRLRLDGNPALAEESCKEGEMYSLKQFRELVRLGLALGVTVVPEIDVPGHAGGWGGASDIILEGKFALDPTHPRTSHQLDPASEKTYRHHTLCQRSPVSNQCKQSLRCWVKLGEIGEKLVSNLKL